eukprot:2257501-Rhodomonas_salina.3
MITLSLRVRVGPAARRASRRRGGGARLEARHAHPPRADPPTTCHCDHVPPSRANVTRHSSITSANVTCLSLSPALASSYMRSTVDAKPGAHVRHVAYNL